MVLKDDQVTCRSLATVKPRILIDDEAMVSLDVRSLFTNFLVDETLEVVHRRLHKDETLMEWTELLPHKLLTCMLELYF